MLDLYAWQGFCLLLMVLIITANYLYERKNR